METFDVQFAANDAKELESLQKLDWIIDAIANMRPGARYHSIYSRIVTPELAQMYASVGGMKNEMAGIWQNCCERAK